jgi:type IV fimbrial biogenesis protein FimT
MKFTCKMLKKSDRKNAAPAVTLCSGFTLIEVLTVVIIIGILATLAYSSLMELIFTSRAKETAQTIRSFTERALMDAKRKKGTVKITMNVNNITAQIYNDDGTLANEISEVLSLGYTPDNNASVAGTSSFGATGATSELRFGLSGISKEGNFAACGTRGYCGAAVKTATNNSFVAFIRKGTGKDWEPL